MILKFNFKLVVKKNFKKSVFSEKCLCTVTRSSGAGFRAKTEKVRRPQKSEELLDTLNPSIGTVMSFILFMSQKVGPSL
jgi:hypothetical protein